MKQLNNYEFYTNIIWKMNLVNHLVKLALAFELGYMRLLNGMLFTRLNMHRFNHNLTGMLLNNCKSKFPYLIQLYI